MSALILSFTVFSVVALGIFVAYGAVLTILHAFAYQSRQRLAASPMLVPSQTHASGD
jgi:hypothetical protein